MGVVGSVGVVAFAPSFEALEDGVELRMFGLNREGDHKG